MTLPDAALPRRREPPPASASSPNKENLLRSLTLIAGIGLCLGTASISEAAGPPGVAEGAASKCSERRSGNR